MKDKSFMNKDKKMEQKVESWKNVKNINNQKQYFLAWIALVSVERGTRVLLFSCGLDWAFSTFATAWG